MKFFNIVQNIFLVLNSSEFCVRKIRNETKPLYFCSNKFCLPFRTNKNRIKLFLRFENLLYGKMHQAFTFNT